MPAGRHLWPSAVSQRDCLALSHGGVSKQYWGRKHDTLLFYAKTDAYAHTPLQERIYYESQFFTTEVDEKGRYYADVYIRDVWDDIKPLINVSKERTGYPTQKPLALYERIIKASSNPGDLVLDPFCGCATTPVAAERQGRQWVGMDIWDKAHQQVLDRLAQEGLMVKGRRRPGQQALRRGDITYAKTAPKRTDAGDTAAEALTLRPPPAQAPRHPAPRGQHGKLLTDIGPFCQGCGADYQFDPRVLEVDHINPRSQGGTDAYENLTLLCPPCNKEKRDRYTLIGLQQANRTAGYMKNENNLRMGRAQGRTGRRRRG